MPSLGELLDQGDLKQVSDEATQRLRKNPNDGEAMIALAKVALMEGNEAKATTLLQQAAPRVDKGELIVVRGAMAIKRRDWKKGRELYASLVNQNPPRYEVLMGLGVCLNNLGQHDEARVLFERLVAKGTPNPGAHFELGRAYHVLNQFRRAVRQYVLCLRMNRKQDGAWYGLVVLLAGRGKSRLAESILQLALDQMPDSPLLRDLLEPDPAAPPPAAPSAAKVPVVRGLAVGRSSAKAPAPLPSDTRSPEYLLALGKQVMALIDAGQGREAIKRIQEARQLGASSLGLRLLEGRAYESVIPPDVDGVVRVYEETSALFPKHWEPGNALGLFLLQQGRSHTQDAIRAFEESRKRAPDRAEPRFNLAQAYYQDSKFAESLALVEQLLKDLKPTDAAMHGAASQLLKALEAKLPKKA